MRSRRVILRLAPYVLTVGLLGSTLAWQNVATQQVNDDLGTPGVVVDETAIPTVRSDVPVEPSEGARRSPAGEPGQGGAEVEGDGSVLEPSADAPVVIAELTPREIDPFAMVGVTWASGVPEAAEVAVRWRGKQGWSDWADLHQDLVPDEGGRPGTEPHWVEWADAIAVRVTSPVRAVPQDLQISTVDPGDVRGIAPVAAAKPGIISRAQWRARAQGNCSDPKYGTTKGAVIHHTVGSNSYTKAASAGIVRSIQAFHMNSRNWCDIGYNFLVDRYGQIFEGRGGGMARQVRAAHSGNAAANLQTVGVSLMGTFSNAAPTPAMKAATARLVAWRFSIARVPAKGLVEIGGKRLHRISGHRDVHSTECPGRYVYSWIGAAGGLRDTVARTMAPVPAVGGFHGIVRGTSAIDYDWNPVKGAAKYQLVISRKATFATYGTRLVAGTGVRVARLLPGRDYYAKVRALRPDGRALTSYSITLRRTTSPPPGSAGVPQGVRVTARSSSGIALAWQATPKAVVYHVRLSRSPSMASASHKRVKTTRASYAGLSANTPYYAQVRAIDRNGAILGRWSNRITTRTAVNTNATAARPVAVPASGSYTFRGHGYGHGIGMGQYGAAGAARSGKTYSAILSHYYPGTTHATKSGRIRVLITADTTRNVKIVGKPGIKFRIGSGASVALPSSVDGEPVERWSIEQEGDATSTLRYRTDGDWHTSRTWNGPARFEAPTLGLIMPDESVRTYRTSLVAAHPKAGSSGRDTVNELSLDDYTRGVVAREMVHTWPAEALKAQAVAARTYGARAIRTTSYYDICDTTSCQVYGGVTSEKPSTNAAVTATAGTILTYQGLPAYTQFSASTGGYTDRGTKPYLRPVADPWDNWSGNIRHSWSISVSAAKISSKYPSIGTLRSLQVTSRNGHGEWGGRVTGLKLVGSKATTTITGNDARWAFGLRSNWFTF